MPCVRVGVPTELAVSASEPVPRIDHYDVSQQQNIILQNARVSMMGRPSIALLLEHEYTELKTFLTQILLDSDRQVQLGKDPFWDKAYYATYIALIRCLRLRYSGVDYDLMHTLSQIGRKFNR